MPDVNRYNTERVPEFQAAVERRTQWWADRWSTVKDFFKAIEGPYKYERSKRPTKVSDRELLRPESDEEKLHVINDSFEGAYKKPISEGNTGELTEFFKENPHFDRMLQSIGDSFLESSGLAPLDAEAPVQMLQEGEKIEDTWKLISKTDDLKILPEDKRERGQALLNNGNPTYWNPDKQIFMVQEEEEESIDFGILE